jgi:hypothetical protein
MHNSSSSQHSSESLRVALYARVSSQRQAEAQTIASQVAALEARIQSDGFHPEGELCFLDRRRLQRFAAGRLGKGQREPADIRLLNDVRSWDGYTSADRTLTSLP